MSMRRAPDVISREERLPPGEVVDDGRCGDGEYLLPMADSPAKFPLRAKSGDAFRDDTGVELRFDDVGRLDAGERLDGRCDPGVEFRGPSRKRVDAAVIIAASSFLSGGSKPVGLR